MKWDVGWREYGGEMSRVRMCLKDAVETKSSINFLDYRKVILITPSNGGYRTSTGHLSSPSEASSDMAELHLIELLDKEVP